MYATQSISLARLLRSNFAGVTDEFSSIKLLAGEGAARQEERSGHELTAEEASQSMPYLLSL